MGRWTFFFDFLVLVPCDKVLWFFMGSCIGLDEF